MSYGLPDGASLFVCRPHRTVFYGTDFMTRPLVANIDIAAMQHNLSVVRNTVPRAKIWAVVKANAYGHGLERSVRAFSDADGFALIEIESAIHLREMGWKKPILLLEGFFYAHELIRKIATSAARARRGKQAKACLIESTRS